MLTQAAVAPIRIGAKPGMASPTLPAVPLEPVDGKVRLRVSYGGYLAMSLDKQWKYQGGESYLESVPTTWKYADLMFRLSEKANGAVAVKYQLPGDDLDPDSLISVTDDDDLQEMFEEYFRGLKAPGTPIKTFRLRMLLFSAAEEPMTPEELLDGHHFFTSSQILDRGMYGLPPAASVASTRGSRGSPKAVSQAASVALSLPSASTKAPGSTYAPTDAHSSSAGSGSQPPLSDKEETVWEAGFRAGQEAKEWEQEQQAWVPDEYGGSLGDWQQDAEWRITNGVPPAPGQAHSNVGAGARRGKGSASLSGHVTDTDSAQNGFSKAPLGDLTLGYGGETGVFDKNGDYPSYSFPLDAAADSSGNDEAGEGAGAYGLDTEQEDYADDFEDNDLGDAEAEGFVAFLPHTGSTPGFITPLDTVQRLFDEEPEGESPLYNGSTQKQLFTSRDGAAYDPDPVANGVPDEARHQRSPSAPHAENGAGGYVYHTQDPWYSMAGGAAAKQGTGSRRASLEQAREQAQGRAASVHSNGSNRTLGALSRNSTPSKPLISAAANGGSGQGIGVSSAASNKGYASATGSEAASTKSAKSAGAASDRVPALPSHISVFGDLHSILGGALSPDKGYENGITAPTAPAAGVQLPSHISVFGDGDDEEDLSLSKAQERNALAVVSHALGDGEVSTSGELLSAPGGGAAAPGSGNSRHQANGMRPPPHSPPPLQYSNGPRYDPHRPYPGPGRPAGAGHLAEPPGLPYAAPPYPLAPAHPAGGHQQTALAVQRGVHFAGAGGLLPGVLPRPYDAPDAQLATGSSSDSGRAGLALQFPGVHRVPRAEVHVRDKIGEGAFGEVSLATCAVFGRVAVKWLKPGKMERHWESFWREAEILASVNHPNVLRFYGVVVESSATPGVSGIMTEYMRNGSLSQLLRDAQAAGRYLTLKQRAHLAHDACAGLAYLHQMNIVHFDLKPDNLLLDGVDTELPTVKVADFGLSKHKWKTWVSGVRDLRGTLPYMAPELVSDPDRVDEKADVWSIGVVFWEMLTCEVPYQHLTPQQIVTGLMCGSLAPDIPDWCEPEWRTLMEMCWHASPGSRPSMRDLARHLDTICDSL